MYENNISSPSTVSKEYKSPFLIDQPKLSRIINVLEDKFKTLQLKFEPAYIIILLRGDLLHLKTIEEIFELDNTIRNPIRALQIEVDYADQKKLNYLNCSIRILDTSLIKNISLSVSSHSSKITLETFAIVEEQIQRIFLYDWVYWLNSNSSLFLLLSPMVLTFIALLRELFPSNEKILIELLEVANNAETNEEKMIFLFEATKYDIEQQIHNNSSFNLSNLLNFSNFVIASTVLIVFGCGFYAVKYCYPTGVFLWGDYEIYYKRLVEKRKTLWGVVILGLAVGIIGGLFVTVLAGRINL